MLWKSSIVISAFCIVVSVAVACCAVLCPGTRLQREGIFLMHRAAHLPKPMACSGLLGGIRGAQCCCDGGQHLPWAMAMLADLCESGHK